MRRTTAHETGAPIISLHLDTIRNNAILWQRHCGKPVWAVVKSDGYGWGAERLVQALNPVVAGYCVADSAEFERLRALSALPILLFSQPTASELPRVVLCNGYPNITSLEALEQVVKLAEGCGRPLRVRLGLAPSLGWFGLAPQAIEPFIAAARSPWLEVELWSHLTSAAAQAQERADFAAFIQRFRAGGVHVAAIDLESSAPASQSAAAYDRARVGIGLFGAYSGQVPGLRCAFELTAMVRQQVEASPELRIGYNKISAPPTAKQLLTIRLGYGDGLPRSMVGAQLDIGTILNIGMQYTVIDASKVQGDDLPQRVMLLDHRSNVSAILQPSSCSMYELVVDLGRSSRISR